ncbi:MAG TPA: glycosyltransferase family 2 protein [Herpetosiphonaceae bacterium]
MWNGKTVSVIFPTYNEKDSIYDAIQEFFATGWIDEIVVVNNNAAPGTAEEVARTKARQVFETKQGYGYALRRGMAEATGDLILWAEPDGTFVGKDVEKLLVYSGDFPVVFGTRTCTSLIGSGANMGMFLRYGNVFVAKLLEALFNTYTLTDVGCTMRVMTREALEIMQPHFRSGSSYFGLEFMLLTIVCGFDFVQIPVTYRSRVGESSVTGDFGKAFALGMQMIFYVIWSWIVFWFRRVIGKPLPYQRGAASNG